MTIANEDKITESDVTFDGIGNWAAMVKTDRRGWETIGVFTNEYRALDCVHEAWELQY